MDWKKRCERLKTNNQSDIEKTVDIIIKRGEAKKALLLHQIIASRVKQRYKATKSDKEKRLISSIVYANKILKRHRLCAYSKRSLGISNRDRRSKLKAKIPRSMKLVFDFLHRDDNSRIKAGKKATITRKGEKRQIRLLSYDLKTLHSKFLIETKIKLSYTLFCNFKPFNIIKPTAKDRETCLCRICQNMELKVERCHHEKSLKNRDIDKVLESVTCKKHNKACMYRECAECKGKLIHFEENIDIDKQVTWFEWKTKRLEKEKKVNGETVNTTVNVTAKEKEGGSLQVLCDELNKAVQRVSKHVFNIRHQYQSLRHLKVNLSQNELIVHIDFSENFNCKYSSEVQSMHFGSSQRQISLHTGVAYTTENTLSFCTVSDCLKHSPAAIWAHLDPILKYLKEETGTTIVHFVSDGPTTQYRNKHNFYLMSKKVFEYGFGSATLNFLEAGHGKGAADGIGPVIKRTADGFILRGGDITGAEDLQKTLDEAGSKVKVVIINEKDVNNVEGEVPLTIKPLPRTMQIQQILVPSPGLLKYRPLSCFCQKPEFCNCFAPETASFSFQTEPDSEPEGDPHTAQLEQESG